MMTRSKSRKEAIVKYLFALPVILLLLIAFSKKEAIANNENLATENIEINNLENLNSIEDVEKFITGDVDEMPRFPGCEEITEIEKRDKCAQNKLLTFIYTQIKYPAEARKAGIQGKVIVKYVVQKDGTVANARIEREIGGGCGEAALKVINALPKMIPGTKDGKAVDVQMTIPVQFKLEGDSEKTPKSTEEKAEKKDLKNSPGDITVVGFAPKSKKLDGQIYKVVEEMPRFKNADCEKMEVYQEQKKCAEQAMLNYIYSNIKYPKAASKAGIQGRVIIKFVVQKDGSIADAKVLRDPGGGCGVEAERVVNMMPNFVPGKQKGKAVNVSYTLPVSFKLADPDPKADVKIEDNTIKLNKDMKPLFIVDGVEFDKSAAGELKPDDIATINVLKGEKATEKYGDKGKNGVVEITLKKGKSKSKAKKEKWKSSFESLDDKNIKALFVIDGKIVDKSVYQNLSPDEIATINILGGDSKMIAKYGDKGKDGVVEIITKNHAHQFDLENVDMEAVKKKDLKLSYIKISPNPSNGVIDIEYESEDKPMTISIFDLSGKKVFEKKVAGGRSSLKNVDLSKEAKGIFFLTFEQGGKTYREKVILQ